LWNKVLGSWYPLVFFVAEHFIKILFWNPGYANIATDYTSYYARISVGVSSLLDGCSHGVLVEFVLVHILGPQQEVESEDETPLDPPTTFLS